MILLFLRWLLRLPFLLVIGTLLAGMLIGTYKIFTHFWGEDIFSEILKRREKEKQLNKKIRKIKIGNGDSHMIKLMLDVKKKS